jgi:hypothetical protein
MRQIITTIRTSAIAHRLASTFAESPVRPFTPVGGPKQLHALEFPQGIRAQLLSTNHLCGTIILYRQAGAHHALDLPGVSTE